MRLRHLLFGCSLVLAGCTYGAAPTSTAFPADEPPGGDGKRDPKGPIVLPHSDSVVGVAFTPDGKTLVASDNNSVRLWDTATGKEKAALKNGKSGAKPVAVSLDGKLIAAGNWDKTVRLWDGAGGAEVATLVGHVGPVLTVAFSPDGALLATGGRSESWVGEAQVKLWDLRTRTESASLPGIADPVGKLAFSPDGKTLAVGDVRGGLVLWDVASKQVRQRLKGQTSVSIVVWSPDGRRLVSGGSDIRIWESDTGKLLTTLPVGDNTDDCFGLAITKDGKLLASGSHRGNIKVWDVRTGEAKLTLQRAPVRVEPTVRPIQELGKDMVNNAYCVALSPDDSLLAAGVGPTVRIWDIKSLLPTGAAGK